MSLEPFLGEIMLVGFNFAPRSWAFCSGQLLSIAQNQALFSLLGTMYGGDGRTDFALPDLRGRVPVGVGQGPGLSTVQVGQTGGTETVTLDVSQLPTHTHTAQTVTNASSSTATQRSPEEAIWATEARGRTQTYINNTEPDIQMSENAIQVNVNFTGGDQAINNRQPYLGLNYVIALEGIFPSRE